MKMKAALGLFGGALCGAVLFAMAPNSDRSRRSRLKPFKNCYIAHRGYYNNDTDRPENSMKAFISAAEHGFGIELDVRLTKDNIPVVIHDEDLYRVCGIHKRVEDVNYSELISYKLFNSDETIPLFEDVLKELNGKVPLVIEIKAEYEVFDICNTVMRKLYCYPGIYCIESFSPFVLKWFKDHEPNVLRGQLSMDFFDTDKEINKPWIVKFGAKNLLTNTFSRPDFISYEWKGAESLPMILHRKVFESNTAAWTVRNKEDLRYAEKYFDMIIFEGFDPKE